MNNPLKSPLLSRWPYSGRCPDGANSLNEPIRPYIKGEENSEIRSWKKIILPQKFELISLF